MRFSPTISIDGRTIGPGHPPYIIAEMSNNHNRDLGRALAMIDAAAEAGADAVKVQTYTADAITIDHDGPGFCLEEGLWAGRTLYQLYSEIHMPLEWHGRLFERARRAGITLFSSPFDPAAVELLEDCDAPAYKIASFEAVDLALIEKCAATGKPVLVSTGVVGPDEISEALETIHRAGNQQAALLHCVSSYPARPQDFNLRAIPRLAQTYEVVTGLSDHCLDSAVAVAAVALGASIIEKHFILSRDNGGPDAAFSLEPQELRQLVDSCRAAYASLARPGPGDTGANYSHLRRSLYAVADIGSGEIITKSNVRSIRPGFGLPPKFLPKVLGSTARSAIARGTPLDWDLLDL